jgi:hypothetical protein
VSQRLQRRDERLRREERLEDAGGVLAGNADAGVDDVYARERVDAPQLLAGTHDEGATTRHRLETVEHEVVDRLPNQPRIHRDRRQSRLDVDAHVYRQRLGSRGRRRSHLTDDIGQ